MANPEQLAILKQGPDAWNRWRAEHPFIRPDLTGVDLSMDATRSIGVNLHHANFADADLRNARLPRAELQRAQLQRADCTGANLEHASLMEADLGYAVFREASLRGAKINDARAWCARFSDADLRDAKLWGSDFRKAEFPRANLAGADLRNTLFVNVNFQGAVLDGCDVFGMSAWDVDLEGATHKDLNISRPNEPAISVNDLEVAQFMFVLLDNRKLRRVIETITSKLVLILGRFTPERKQVLDAIRDALLSEHDYIPVLFDSEKPATRDTGETVTLLARMARFIVADVTEPKSILQELADIVPALPSVPVQPILHESGQPSAMWDHLSRYPWVLPIARYGSLQEVLPQLRTLVIDPVETRLAETRAARL